MERVLLSRTDSHTANTDPDQSARTGRQTDRGPRPSGSQRRIYRRRGLPTDRCAVCSRKSRDCASAGRYCGRIDPTEREILASRAAGRRATAGPTRIGEASGPARCRAAIAVVNKVMITVMAVAARIIPVIMFTIVVSFIVVPRQAGDPTRLISAHPAPRDPLRSTTAAVFLPPRSTAETTLRADAWSAPSFRYRIRTPRLLCAPCQISQGRCRWHNRYGSIGESDAKGTRAFRIRSPKSANPSPLADEWHATFRLN